MNPVIPASRRSTRLKGYNYAQEGAYFVTVSTHLRTCTMGSIRTGAIILSSQGKEVLRAWQSIPVHFPGVTTPATQIMPNHLHGIVRINAATPQKLVAARSAQSGTSPDTHCAPHTAR